jgi:hypothetical protein
LEDCFEAIICFETLNPPLEPVDCMDVPDGDAVLAGDYSPEVNAIGLTGGTRLSFSSKSRILCKPSVEAIEAAIQIANIDPKKTVKLKSHLQKKMNLGLYKALFGMSNGDRLFPFFRFSSMTVSETLQVGKQPDSILLL